jgi:hypothetical protein
MQIPSGPNLARNDENKGLCGTTEEAAEEVGKAGRSTSVTSFPPLGMTRIKKLYGAVKEAAEKVGKADSPRAEAREE